MALEVVCKLFHSRAPRFHSHFVVVVVVVVVVVAVVVVVVLLSLRTPKINQVHMRSCRLYISLVRYH